MKSLIVIGVLITQSALIVILLIKLNSVESKLSSISTPIPPSVVVDSLLTETPPEYGMAVPSPSLEQVRKAVRDELRAVLLDADRMAASLNSTPNHELRCSRT